MRESKIKMPVDRHFTRIDILEIKIQIGKKLGNQKAEKYFGLLDRFFSLKLGKSEFDKLCIATVGRENIRLHNSLIKSILKNVLLSKGPPPKGNKLEKPLNDTVVDNGYRRTCLKSLCRDSLPPSPRRGRTPGFRDRRSKDRPSPLGPNGKPSNALSFKDLGQKALEQQSATELLSLGSQPIEANSVEDGEEVDQAAAISPGIHSRSPVLTPPFGIPWNGKGNRKVLSANSLSPYGVHVETCYSSGELPDTSSLRKRLEEKLQSEGLRVSLDCVNLFNSGLDVFLKRLIKPSLELATSRIESKQPNQMWPARNYQEQPMPNSVSVLDFRTAMELDPQILGEDWPVQLEKITLRHTEHWEGN